MKKPAPTTGPAFSKLRAEALFAGVVLAPLLRHPALFLHFAENAIEVIGFDFHRFGDFGSRDTRVLLNQGNCLIGASTATAPAPAPWGARGGGRGCFRGAARTAATSRRATWTAGDCATKLGAGALEALELLTELCDALVDEVESLVEYVAGARHFLPFIP
jgi:hypothetical protein